MPRALVVTLRDDVIDLDGYVVVDKLVAGKAMGGLRMTADVTPGELASLARQMTLKLALARLPIGGAKGGIVSHLPHGEKRDRCLRGFGELAAPLLKGGIYVGTDQGINYRDRALVFDAAGYEVGKINGGPTLPCSWAELWDRCAEITGFGVTEAISAAVSDESSVLTVAIHGFGTVGRGTAIHLAARGYRVLAVADQFGTMAHSSGLPIEALVAATDAAGVVDRSRLPADIRRGDDPEAVLEVPADILVLAVGADTLREEHVGQVRRRLVVEGANNPCTDGALAALAARGVPVLPGIVANAGGAIATGAVLTGQAGPAHDADTLAASLHSEVRHRIRAAYAAVLERATADGLPLPQAAAQTAADHAATPGGGVLETDVRHEPTHTEGMPQT